MSDEVQAQQAAQQETGQEHAGIQRPPRPASAQPTRGSTPPQQPHDANQQGDQGATQAPTGPDTPQDLSAFPDVPHLQAYLQEYVQENGIYPQYYPVLDINSIPGDRGLIYPLPDDMFIHVRKGAEGRDYHVIEPPLPDEDRELLLKLREDVFARALYLPPPQNQQELEQNLRELYDGAAKAAGVPPEKQGLLQYYLIRDVARYGPLEPFLLDPYLEDIQSVGTDAIHVIHKFFDMLPSNVHFRELEEVDTYVRNLSERIGRPVSDARPIVDATLDDGSRINIIYSEDVSRKGPSFSIRRVHENPISVTQLIEWGTLTAELAAYVWLCLENGMSVMVCGEAACGKSATLNALLAFVDPRAKIYSAEDTPEVRPPHPVWQRLLTRETGPKDARVEMFDLLKAALRSRPDYIVVGEIRGAEGAVAFQAMQTGHPTVATFHATDKVKMIQRLHSDPINIPLTFLDNLNVAIFQEAMYRQGRLIRRATSVDEIQGYSELDGGVITLPVFSYKAQKDQHSFNGRNNSFILEKKIAEQHGYEDPSEIYDVLDERARVLQAMVDNGITQFDEVNKVIFDFHDGGVEGLPFDVPGLEGGSEHH